MVQWIKQGQAYIPSQHFPYQVRTGERGWGLTEQQSNSDVPEPSENLLCLQKGRAPASKRLRPGEDRFEPLHYCRLLAREPKERRCLSLPFRTMVPTDTFHKTSQWIKPQKLSMKWVLIMGLLNVQHEARREARWTPCASRAATATEPSCRRATSCRQNVG